MTDPEKPALDDLLSSFALGPAWARQSGKDEKPPHSKGKSRERSDQRRGNDDRGGRDDRGDQRRGRDDRGDRFKGGRNKFQDRGGRFEPRQRQEAEPAKDIRVIIIPDQASVHLIVKEVQQVARVYPLFDIAKILLVKHDRCRAVFETANNHPPIFRSKHDDSLFLTREEAMNHLWSSDLREKFLDEETIEVDPPSGNFQSVAKCGLSGEWVGPPNFHTYQTNLRRIHRERFGHMPFESYSAKVRTERGEEAVNEWLESMKVKTRWRLKGSADDEPWLDDRSQAERLLATKSFDEAFDTTNRAELPGAVNFKHLSPALVSSLKLASSHARRHPAMLIPTLCKVIEAEHLPVFKRQGKLYTGPVRPHPLPADTALAPRPAQMVDWIRANTPGAKLEGLWKAVLPEGSTAPPAEYAADLFWLLTQGHILLFTDDTLVVQELRPQQQPSKKKAKKQAKAETAETPAAETPSESTPNEAPEATTEAIAEVAPEEAPIVEAPADEPIAEVAPEEPVAETTPEPAVKPSPEPTPEPPAAAVEPLLNDPTSVDNPPEPPVVMDTVESAEPTTPSAEAEPEPEAEAPEEKKED